MQEKDFEDIYKAYIKSNPMDKELSEILEEVHAKLFEEEEVEDVKYVEGVKVFRRPSYNVSAAIIAEAGHFESAEGQRINATVGVDVVAEVIRHSSPELGEVVKPVPCSDHCGNEGCYFITGLLDLATEILDAGDEYLRNKGYLKK